MNVQKGCCKAPLALTARHRDELKDEVTKVQKGCCKAPLALTARHRDGLKDEAMKVQQGCCKAPLALTARHRDDGCGIKLSCVQHSCEGSHCSPGR